MTPTQLKAYTETLTNSVDSSIRYTRPDGTQVHAMLVVKIDPPNMALLPTLPETPTKFEAVKLALGGFNSNHFMATAPDQITWPMCTQAQRELGYSPEGYGQSVPIIQQYTNGWKATWNCSGSCE